MNTVIFNDHLYTNEAPPVVNINDRAFRYGDGLFETMIYDGTKIRFFNDHFERLSSGIETLKMTKNKDFNVEEIESRITNLLVLNGHPEMARIRIQVWRKEGGLFAPETNNMNYLIESFDLKYGESTEGFEFPYMGSVNVCFSSSISLSYSNLSSLKTCNSLPYIMAAIEKNEVGVDDIIIPDHEGNIAECISSNIFWLQNNVIYTSSLKTGCVAGIMRKNIIRRLNDSSILTEEIKLPIKEILNAEIIFLTNVTGIRVVKQLEQKIFSDHSLKEFVNSHYFSSIQQLF